MFDPDFDPLYQLNTHSELLNELVDAVNNQIKITQQITLQNQRLTELVLELDERIHAIENEIK